MFESHVIEANGIFIGAAMSAIGGFRFRAVHPQVDELDGSTWKSLEDLRRATGTLFKTGRLGALDPAGSIAPGQSAAP
jgi:hypothetical protein